MSQPIRQFSTGATRDADTNKADYEGFLSPLALRRYGEYMNRHRKQSDGSLRESDNWQRGIPLDAYMKSGFRHFMDWWSSHRGYITSTGENVEEEICALIFNASGYLHELLKAKESNRSVPWSSWMVRGFPVPHELSQTTELASSHPMAAESLRDEYERDDQGTGV